MSPEFEKFIMETVTKILKFIKWYIIIAFSATFIIGILAVIISLIFS